MSQGRAEQAAPTPPPRPSRLRVWLGHLGLAVFAVAFFVVGVRLGMADTTRWSKWLFYIPVLLPLMAGCIGLALMRGAWLWRLPLGVLLLATVLVATHREQPRLFALGEAVAPEATDGPTLRVVTWNVMGYARGEQQVVETVRELEPDVLCVVEGTFGGRAPHKLARALGSEYKWVVGTRLSVASRHRIIEGKMILERDGIVAFRVLLEFDGKPLAVVVLDVIPPEYRRDKKAFNTLWAAMETMDGDVPTIVTGDLNAPRGSAHLARAMARFHDAYDSPAAPRYLATWPAILPLWQIDHTFHSDHLEPRAALLPATKASDHLPLVVDFALIE